MKAKWLMFLVLIACARPSEAEQDWVSLFHRDERARQQEFESAVKRLAGEDTATLKGEITTLANVYEKNRISER